MHFPPKKFSSFSLIFLLFIAWTTTIAGQETDITPLSGLYELAYDEAFKICEEAAPDGFMPAQQYPTGEYAVTVADDGASLVYDFYGADPAYDQIEAGVYEATRERPVTVSSNPVLEGTLAYTFTLEVVSETELRGTEVAVYQVEGYAGCTLTNMFTLTFLNASDETASDDANGGTDEAGEADSSTEGADTDTDTADTATSTIPVMEGQRVSSLVSHFTFTMPDSWRSEQPFRSDNTAVFSVGNTTLTPRDNGRLRLRVHEPLSLFFESGIDDFSSFEAVLSQFTNQRTSSFTTIEALAEPVYRTEPVTDGNVTSATYLVSVQNNPVIIEMDAFADDFENSEITLLSFAQSMNFYGSGGAPRPASELPVLDVVFERATEGGFRTDIYSVNLETTQLRRILNADVVDTQTIQAVTQTYGDRSPLISPDGTRIYFISTRAGFTSLWSMNSDGTDLRALLPGSFITNPALSASGQGLAFQYVADESFQNVTIDVMGIDGADRSTVVRLSAGFDGFPEWSPSGLVDELGYQLVQNGNVDLYSGSNRLTTSGANDYDLAWSPDGTQIAYSSERDGNLEIYVQDLETGAIQRITNNNARDFNPHFSPDGTQILFHSDRDGGRGQQDLYLMNADGSNVRRITQLDGQERFPDWRWSLDAVAAAQEDDTESDTADEAETSDEAETTVSDSLPECTITGNGVNRRTEPTTNSAADGRMQEPETAIGQTTGTDGFVWWQLASGLWVRSDVVAEGGDCEALPQVGS